jgi:hypothetical protein
MRRCTVIALLSAVFLVPAVALTSSAPAGPGPARASQLVAFRGFHFGGGYGFTRRHYGLGGFGRRGSSHIGRRVIHALAFAYFLHLFFTHGGLSILLWLLIIFFVAHLLRRRRSRRRYA